MVDFSRNGIRLCSKHYYFYYMMTGLQAHSSPVSSGTGPGATGPSDVVYGGFLKQKEAAHRAIYNYLYRILCRISEYQNINYCTIKNTVLFNFYTRPVDPGSSVGTS